MAALLQQFPREGRVEWIGVRPRRRADLLPCLQVEANAGAGLAGDHYNGVSGQRGVTLIQAEHLEVIAALTGHQAIHPARLRRNLVISGINLYAVKGAVMCIGECRLEYTGQCHPCSRMEEALGPGGYNAMRGHGGINARVLVGGCIRLGDPVLVLGTGAETAGLDH